MGSLRDAQNFATLEMQVETKMTFVFSFICPLWCVVYRSDAFDLILSILVVLRTLGVQTASQKIKFMECFQESMSLHISLPSPLPLLLAQVRLNDGVTQLVSTEPIPARQIPLMVASWQGWSDIPATHGYCFQARLLLCSWLSRAVMSKQTLHQSRLMFEPRETGFHSHLDNVTCGRLGRGQLCPWGNACWLRNSCYCIFW